MNNWISADDALPPMVYCDGHPDEHASKIVFVSDGNEIHLMQLLGNGGWSFSTPEVSCSSYGIDVKYWMHVTMPSLPQIPQNN